MNQTGSDTQVTSESGPRTRLLLILVVVALFAGLLVAKVVSGNQADPASGAQAAEQPSMVRDDPVEAYEAALSGGKPVYVLFHSLSCQPCVEISAVVDQVVPEYAGRVTFVNVITDDPAGQQLASRFDFQYIPTSFFITADAGSMESHTGVLTADQMRAKLDELLETQ